MRVIFCFFLLFLFFVSPIFCSSSPGIKFGLRGQTAVNLYAEWKPDGQYTSKLYYTFCSNLPQSARVMLGNITKIRFIHYTDYSHTFNLKYDQIHLLPNTEIDSGTGCMKGVVMIHQPFEQKKPSDTYVLLLMKEDQDMQTNDNDVKYRLFDV